MHFQRLLLPPKNMTFFLFGPRGTGKSTWIKEHFGKAKIQIDLLKSSDYLRYQRDRSLLSQEVEALNSGDWVVIDKIQKLPSLLDEVHSILFERNAKIHFVLSGSSARKIKKLNGNLLAGRALTRKMYCLSALEMGSAFKLESALSFGMLPAIRNEHSDEQRIDRLDSYVETYLKEEIQQEAVVRNLDSFFRFLQIAAIYNGQLLNMSNISRDVGISRSTVQGYFEILTDTLIAWHLPAFKLRAKSKEVSHPKFYLFDCGVQRTLAGEHRNILTKDLAGHLFETLVLNEIRLLTSSLGIGAEMSYWHTESGTEVDLIWHRGHRRFGFDIKHTNRWKPEYNKGLNILLSEKKIEKAYGIFTGPHALKQGSIMILPFQEALEKMRRGEIGF